MLRLVIPFNRGRVVPRLPPPPATVPKAAALRGLVVPDARTGEPVDLGATPAFGGPSMPRQAMVDGSWRGSVVPRWDPFHGC
ncbi:MAG TPA: hypothetical protein VGV93_12545 [Acidimicrobiales bacterium]|nr:hypothetical protein [Acidimicrobiales bacterium]